MNDRGSPVASAPAFSILLGLCCSIFLSNGGFQPTAAIAAGMLLSSSWMFVGSSRLTSGWLTYFFIIVFLSCFFSVLSIYRIEKIITIPDSVETNGKILTNRPWGKRRALLISTPFGKFASYAPQNNAPAEGSKVLVRGAVFDLKRADKRNGFDEYLYWSSKGAVKKLIILDIKTLARPTGIHRWRNFLEERIRDTLPERMAGYMLALTVGIRDEKLTELHRNDGTVHLLAVSGFHVGILAAFVSLFFSRGLRKILGVSVFIWFYILLAGAPAGGVRAALMLQVYLLGLLIGKPSNGFNSVSVAGIVLLLQNPWFFFDIGWRLSMLAALFLSASGPLMRRSWINAVAASVLVWFVTAPQVAIVFKEVPVIGLMINTIAIPLFSLLFPLVLLFSVPSLFYLPFASIIADACEYVLESWGILSRVLVAIFPWSIEFTLPLLLFSSALFGVAAAYASGVSPKKIPFFAAFFPIFILLFA